MSHNVASPVVSAPDTARDPVTGCSVVRLPVDTDLLPLHRARPQRYPHLLESVAHGTPQARFDILFACPGVTLTLGADHAVTFDGQTTESAGFLSAFDDWWYRERGTERQYSGDLPFRGGWFVYLGYELAAEIEPGLRLPDFAGGLPVAFATRFPAAIIRDHYRRVTWLVAEYSHEQLLPAMAGDLEHAAAASVDAFPTGLTVTEDDQQPFLDGVQRIKRYVREGDIFQVNLSRAWRLSGEHQAIDAAQVYSRLRATNPAPFSGLVTCGDAAIISSSPERLVQVTANAVTTRPIAGTRPRGATTGDDQRLSQTLLAHPKERAEHIMLIDLERNDLGRICRPGTVTVDELMVLESYAHVHHIVSNVTGGLKENIAPGDVIRAVFPGGTITGCPKVRCMEIIAELERTGRGPYTGSVGYINRDGSMDLNILIRTLVKDGGQLMLRAGAGIVADSVPEMELDETRAKARGLLLALGHGTTRP